MFRSIPALAFEVPLLQLINSYFAKMARASILFSLLDLSL